MYCTCSIDSRTCLTESTRTRTLLQWETKGETKVVLGIKDAAALMQVVSSAEGVPDVTCTVIQVNFAAWSSPAESIDGLTRVVCIRQMIRQDAGRTEVAAGSVTVAVGSHLPISLTAIAQTPSVPDVRGARSRR
jgi:peptidyl-tRNA hydrolase